MNPFSETHTPSLFSERQRFTQWWVWAILVVTLGLSGNDLLQQFISRGSAEAFESALLSVSIVFLVCLLLISIQLKTEIKEEGIYVRLFPFHLKYKFFPWALLAKVYLRRYAPIREYGGWGLRRSLFGYGIAYNIRGKQGLQLVFKSGKKILIGTQESDKVQNILLQMGRLKP